MIELSIIIPVYNVNEYLSDCIKSVLKNPKEEIEVILVDDGSTDNSGDICDQYALKDARIKVYHKKNGGLSSARNYGLQYANGEYIGFVDSDDIVDQRMFVEMLNAACEFSADIVICGIKHFSDNLANTSTCVHSDNVVVAEGSSRLEFFINPKGMGDYAVNKIYKRELFETGIRFPEGHIFEDIYTSYRLFGEAKKVVCLDQDLYYYRMRSGSISHSKKFNPKMIDIVYATKEQLDYIKDNAPEYLSYAYQKHLDANVIEYKHIYETGRLNKEKELVKQIRGNISDLLCVDYPITRFEKEAKAIKHGKAYWTLCCRITSCDNRLNRHPRYQKAFGSLFGKMIFK